MIVQLSLVVLPLDFIIMGVCYTSHMWMVSTFTNSHHAQFKILATYYLQFTAFLIKSQDSQNNNYENEHLCRNSRKMKCLQYLKVLLVIVII